MEDMTQATSSMSITSTARRTSFSFRPTRSLLLTTPYTSIFADDPSQLVDVQIHVEKTLSKEPLRTLNPLTNERSTVSTIDPEIVLLECLASQNERSSLTERARPKGRRQLEAAIINLANQSKHDETAAIQYQHFKQLYDSDPHSTLEDVENRNFTCDFLASHFHPSVSIQLAISYILFYLLLVVFKFPFSH
jgi:hypothetical protein